MARVIVDSSTRIKLRSLTQSVQLCDETGRVLGLFTPAIDPSLYEGVEPLIPEEELQRRQAASGGRTLAEILSDENLQSLPFK